MQKRVIYWASLLFLTGLIVLASVSQALHTKSTDAFPQRPVTIVVTFPPGGGTDLLARRLGAELEHYWQRPVIIENRPGASGVVGARHVVDNATDGHMLLMVNSSYAINPSVFSELGFDPLEDLTGIMNVAWVPSVWVTAPTSAVTVEQLGSADSPPLSYASCGNGTPQHLAGELFQQQTNTQLLHVAYRGCGPALTDVMSGQVDTAIVTVSSAMGLIEAGQLRPLAVTSAERSPVLPNVPSLQESKHLAFDINQWHGLLASSKTPAEHLAQLHAALDHVMQNQNIQDNLKTLGYTSSRTSAREFNQIVATDLQRFQQLIQDAHIQIN